MMPRRKFEITDARGGTAIPVRVVTQADKTELAGIQDDGVLKVRLKASPAGSQAANDELVQLLAAELSVEADTVEIVAGENTREKIVSVEGISAAEVEARLGIGD
ncbi:MAG: DUF167 domain-containing protein [Anaerolineae bacterium]|nr:DUF167 domain-containing protein [Anaerolineae bacterium]